VKKFAMRTLKCFAARSACSSAVADLRLSCRAHRKGCDRQSGRAGMGVAFGLSEIARQDREPRHAPRQLRCLHMELTRHHTISTRAAILRKTAPLLTTRRAASAHLRSSPMEHDP
jgi:hypothetical protein